MSFVTGKGDIDSMDASHVAISTWTFCNKLFSQLTLDIGPSSRTPWRRRVTVSERQESSQRGNQPIYRQTKTRAHKGEGMGRKVTFRPSNHPTNTH